MLGYAGIPTRTVYSDVTLTRSKVKVKVTEHLNKATQCLSEKTQFMGFLFCKVLQNHFIGEVGKQSIV